MNSKLKYYEMRLKMQKKTGLCRKLINISEDYGRKIVIEGQELINFASNDYLGFAHDKNTQLKISKIFAKYSTSSSSARLVTGNLKEFVQAEDIFAKYFGYESALFFPSGYQANLALYSTLFNIDDIVFFDKHVHASILLGLKMSSATLKGFRHNDLLHLQKRCSAKKDISVVCEALYGMDGDTTDFIRLKKLKNQYNFMLCVDEAHSFGCLGEKGRGLSFDCAEIALGTLGKSFGLWGGFLLLPQVIKEFLLNNSSPFIHTTALPRSQPVCAVQMLEIIEQADAQRTKLQELAAYAKLKFIQKNILLRGSAEYILIIPFQDINQVLCAHQFLLEKGFFVLPLRYPTVGINEIGLRISINTMHKPEDIELLASSLEYFLNAK